MEEWIRRVVEDETLLDEVWYSSKETTLRTAYEAAKLLLKMNNLAPKRLRLKHIGDGFFKTYELYLAVLNMRYSSNYKYFGVGLDFEKLIKLDVVRVDRLKTYRIIKVKTEAGKEDHIFIYRANVLSMPKYPIFIRGMNGEERAPFRKGKATIGVIIADYKSLDDEIDIAHSEYEKKYGKKLFSGWGELYDRLKDVWLEKFSFNYLDRRKLRLIKEFAPKTYRLLLNGLRAVEKANQELGIDYLRLWTNIETAWLGCEIDTTEMTIGEVLEILPERIKAVSVIISKLEEVYKRKIYYQLDRLTGGIGIYIGPYTHQWIIW